jgi:hypothetical protein
MKSILQRKGRNLIAENALTTCGLNEKRPVFYSFLTIIGEQFDNYMQNDKKYSQS